MLGDFDVPEEEPTQLKRFGWSGVSTMPRFLGISEESGPQVREVGTSIEVLVIHGFAK